MDVDKYFSTAEIVNGGICVDYIRILLHLILTISQV